MLIIKIRNQAKLLGRSSFRYSNADPKKDYYNILGVAKEATESEIKQSYYKLAMKYHPDHNKGYQQQFKLINQAYSMLSDKTSKREYDSSRTAQHDDFGSQSQTYNNSYPFNRRDRYYEQDEYGRREANWEGNQRTAQNQYYRQAYNWQNSQSYRSDYDYSYEAYSRYRAYAEYAHREFMRKQREKYETEQQPDDEDRLTLKEYTKLKKLLKSAFITGFLISFVFLIPQMLIGPYTNENKNAYRVKQTNKYAYPYQQPDPIEYKNPRGPYQSQTASYM